MEERIGARIRERKRGKTGAEEIKEMLSDML